MTELDFQPTQGSGDFLIRTATIEDVGSLALVIFRANAQRDGQPLPEQADEETRVDMEKRFAKPAIWAYVGVVANKMAGFVLGYPSSEEDSIPTNPLIEYLALLMVEPDYWGYRVASKLLDVAAIHAKNAGKRALLLWTGENNDRARQVYERKGYLLTSQTRVSKRRGPQVQYLLDLSKSK